ncbi:DUF4097 and DUF4098 domain-containing protein YvlB [Microbacteriaceae bacterium SG_E_30_P1]|uniref:DUF4097 and DUF4098 domain-containing protein YvlB n=1 Tax=Antiquaquibacter oligotrophicus TaxID=2880260 RepID=A0ABT6KRQ5_9MICO|nr:DUF4097 family beta strand repeat-containing protein [Antiquaquibacter oligotrophicus]MDH6182539.1 DUF4097 and DUF4098 domain-containing protein YvlB [Antiquaquibacter oligotrophicus]UDF14492.1 DUF4097 domain-containing protein [Antiquaquibacter oligotrophicus]
MAQEKWIIDGPKVIDLDGITALKVGLIGGQVDVIGHDEPGVRVEIHSVTGRDLKVSVDGHTLEIDHPQLRWDNFIDVFSSWQGGTAKADISIRVPRDVALKFGVISATGLISGLRADATISTVNGDLVIDDLTGKLQLNAVGGELSVRGHNGPVTAHTVGGDITASGAITRFSADTVTGEIFLDLSGIPDEVNVNTVSGNVTARLAPDVPVQYRINTVSGKIHLDNAGVNGLRGNYTGRVGSLDKHWTDVKVNTVSGRVSVLQSVTA